MLPKRTLESLRRRRTSQLAERLRAGDAWTDEGWVFSTEVGGPIEPRNLLRSWYLLLDQLDIPRRPIHAARHSAASTLLAEGVPLLDVSGALGHSTSRLTADLYGHILDENRVRVAEAMDRAYLA